MVKYSFLTKAFVDQVLNNCSSHLSFNNNDTYVIRFLLPYFFIPHPLTNIAFYMVIHLETSQFYNWLPTQGKSATRVHFKSKFLKFGFIPVFCQHSSCLQPRRHCIALHLNSKFLEISIVVIKTTTTTKKWATPVLTFYVAVWSFICIYNLTLGNTENCKVQCFSFGTCDF